jgi:hypothetical protein
MNHESFSAGQGHKHRDDREATGHLYGGMARLLRLLRNPRGANRPYSLGAAQAAMRTLATMENSTSPSSRVAATWGTSATGRQYGR